jgi:hypothetical protein
MLDYHVVLDLLPTIASLFFEKKLGDEVRLSAVQSSILLALGLQRKSVEEVEVSMVLIRRQLHDDLSLLVRTATSSCSNPCAVRKGCQENQQAIDRYTKSGHWGYNPRSGYGTDNEGGRSFSNRLETSRDQPR